MAVDYYAMKIAAEKAELIVDTLSKLDEAVALISAFTETDENQELLAKLLENIDDVKQIVGSVDLMETTTDDINKGTYLGSRKLDIDLSLNKTGVAETLTYEAAMSLWTNTANTVYYNKATVTFVDGVTIDVNFVNDDSQPIQVSTHGAIIDQLNSNTAFTAKLENTAILEEVGGRVGTIIRIVDVTGTSSNIERIQLYATTGAFVTANPIHYWALTTSALQTLANRVGDIIALGNDIDKIIVLSSRIDEMLELQTNLTQLLAIHAELTEILTADDSAASALASKNAAATSATSAANSATTATAQATIATNAATTATTQANSIKAVSVESTITGASGTPASVVYNPTTGKFTFVVPQGIKGDKGDNFDVNAVGLYAQRSNYNTQPQGFSFLATDQAMIYFKNSATSGDWSAGSPFGKGDKGDTGVSITGIARTAGNGAAGTTDTYTIYFDNATTSTFNVYNGANGAVMSVAGRSGDVVLTKADVGLSDVDNTSDVNKPISTATQIALDGKADTIHTHTAITGLTVTSLKETSVAMVANDINLANGNLFTKTISGATTLTVSNVPTAGTVGYFILQLTNGGSATVTWFSGVKWAGGTAPTLTASGVDILSFYTIDAGATWKVVSIQRDVK